MTPRQRVLATLAGRRADRPPVSFWHHFAPSACSGHAAIDAHCNFLNRYPVDFLKIMNDNPYPTTREVRKAKDLRDMPVLCGDEEGYGRQLEVIRSLADELSGELPLVTTLFNAWTTLRKIVTPPTSAGARPPVLGGPIPEADRRMEALIVENRNAVTEALRVIAESHAGFVARCLDAGADGIFLSVRDDRVRVPGLGPRAYREIVEPTDRRILRAAAGGGFNILHACGVPRELIRLSNYPVQAINWADRAAGPPMREVMGRLDAVICGGVDNLGTLRDGTPEQVAAQVRDTIAQVSGAPIIVTPGCTFDPDVVPPANLDAMIEAVRGST